MAREIAAERRCRDGVASGGLFPNRGIRSSVAEPAPSLAPCAAPSSERCEGVSDFPGGHNSIPHHGRFARLGRGSINARGHRQHLAAVCSERTDAKEDQMVTRRVVAVVSVAV